MDDSTRTELLVLLEARRTELRNAPRYVVWRDGWFRHFVVDRETSKLKGPYWTAAGAQREINCSICERFE